MYHSPDFFTEAVFAEITRLRVDRPELIANELAIRVRRKKLTTDGYLTVLAADHPARNLMSPPAMGNRLEYAGRIIRCLAGSDLDGLMGTADVIEDIVLANYIYKQKNGGKSFLDNKILVGCVNRSGLSGLEHELLDLESGYLTAKKIKEMHLDAAKMLFRIPNKAEPADRFAIQTMERCAKLTSECVDERLPMLMEPLAVERKPGGGYVVLDEADALIKVVGVAAGLGHSSAYSWLKIPYGPDYARVAKATTLPILMLGGPSTGKPIGVLENFEKGMNAGANVRGALVGRNVIFPGDEDPAVVAQAVHWVVHARMGAHEAMEKAVARRGAGMDVFK